MAKNSSDQAAQSTAGIMQQIESLPASVYYWATIGSIAASAVFMLLGKKNLSIFVGLWPPTFAVIGLFNKQLHPSQDLARTGTIAGMTAEEAKDHANRAARSAKEMAGSH